MASDHAKAIWNILYFDDDEDDYLLTRELVTEIERQKIRLDWARTWQEAFQKIKAKAWDAVLVDYDLGGIDGIQFIRDAIAQGITVPFIMVTGCGRYEVDVEAMQAGAYDYLAKEDLSPALFERVIRYAKERQRVEDELEERVMERTEELRAAMEELQVIEEELRNQLDEAIRGQKEGEARKSGNAEGIERDIELIRKLINGRNRDA